MRRIIVLTAVAGGALAAMLAGTAVVATTEDAATASSVTASSVTASSATATSTTQTCSGDCDGNGMRRGNGMDADRSDHATLPASGNLTADQKQELLYMVEEEKLAHDVYVALGKATGDARFSRIATSESRHGDSVRVLLDRYGLADPTAGAAEGEFTDAGLQSLHDRLVAQGRVSLTAALEVGHAIETKDIADLTEAAQGLAAPDVLQVYQSLTAASRNHLRAFGG